MAGGATLVGVDRAGQPLERPVRINMPSGSNHFQFCKKRSQLVNAAGEFCKWLICNAGLPPYKA